MTEPETSSRSQRALLLAVLVSAALLRAMNSFNGLPYLYEWDEPLIASRALDMLKTGDLNPRAFEYGSLALYMNLAVDYLHEIWRTWLTTSDPPPSAVVRIEIRTFLDTSWLWTFSHPSFLLWNRLLSALIGTATVGLTYLLARRVAGVSAGLLSAAILAGLDYHVVQSALVLPNVTVGCSAVLVAWLAVRYLDHGGAGSFLAAVSACGLAASTKYNAAIFLVVPLAALIFGTKRVGAKRRGWLWGALVVLPPLAFFAGTPYALVEWDLFTRDVVRQAGEYFVSGHGEETIAPGMGHLWHQVRTTADNLGPVLCILTVLGAVWMMFRRNGRFVLILPAIYFLYMAATRVSFHRNFVLVYPFAAIAAGCSGVMLGQAAALVAATRGWAQSPAKFAALGMVALLPIYAIGVSASAGLAVRSRPESRSRAIDWVNARAASRPGAITRIRIAEELRVHSEDLRRLNTPVIVEPLETILCGPVQASDLVIVAPRYARAPLRTPPDAAIRNALATRLPPPAAAIGELTPLVLDGFNREPLIHFIDGAALAGMPALECGRLIPGAELIPLEERIEVEAGVGRIPQGGVARTPSLLLSVGRYALALRVQGNPERSWRPTLTVRILRKSGDGVEEEVRTEEILLGLERVTRMITLDQEASAVLTVQLELNEEPNRERPWAARSITVESMRLIRLPD